MLFLLVVISCGMVFNVSAQIAPKQQAPPPAAPSDKEIITIQVFLKVTPGEENEVNIEIQPCVAYAGDVKLRTDLPVGKYTAKKNELNAFAATDSKNNSRSTFSSINFYQQFQSPPGPTWLLIKVKNGSTAERAKIELFYQFNTKHYGVIPFIGEIETGKFQEIYRFYTDPGRKLFLNNPPPPPAPRAPAAKPIQKIYSGPFLKQSGLIPYRKGDQWGLCDKSKKIVVPCEYPAILMMPSGTHLMVGQGKYGFIKPDGDVIYPVGRCYSISKGRSPGGGFKIVLDMKDANELIPEFWLSNKTMEPSATKFILGVPVATQPPRDNVKVFRENGRVGYKNDWGNIVIPAKYEDGGDFFEGMAAVELNNKWGYVSKQDKALIPFKFNNAGRFSEGMAAVEINGKWGFINTSGRLIIPCRYSWVGDFHNGLVLVETGFMKQGYVDKEGKEYWEE